MSPRERVWFAAAAALSALLAVVLYRALAGHEIGFGWQGQRCVLSQPERLACLAVLPLLAAASRWGLDDLALPQRLLTWSARALVVLCLALALTRPMRLHETRQVSVVFAADVSDSAGPAAQERARGFIERACNGRPAQDCGLIGFARSARRLDRVDQLRVSSGSSAPDPAGQETDLQAALQLAYALHPEGRARRVVLLSDGRQTRGDLESEAAQAARLGIELDFVVLDGQPPAELAVTALVAPALIEVGRPFRLRAELFASRAGDAQLKLFQEGLPAPLAQRDLHLDPGATSLEFPALAQLSGPLAYRLELTPRGPDQFAENNHGSAAGFARGRARVLWVDSDPAQLVAVSRALAGHDFELETRSDAAMPRTAAELAGYDFFVLSDVPAARLPAGAYDAIDRFVRERGGGFLMAGGDHAFGLGGYEHTGFEKLLPVRMGGELRREDHSLALALLIDCSGSMAGSKIDLAKEAARASVEVLGPDDLIEVVGFAGEPDRHVRLQSARNRLGVMQNIARLIAQGGTQLFPALDVAYQDLAIARARIKHVILLTDGQTQESGIPEVIQAMRSENITVSTVGLGRDVNRELLQSAASLGGGRAYFTEDPRNVPRIFVHETTSQKRSNAVEQPTRMHAREPAEFLRGIDLAAAPPLRGYVATQAKPRPSQVLLESDSGEPLLARVRVGLGYSLAFMPDLKGRWSAELLRWSEFDRFLSQLLREHVRKPEVDELPLRASVEAGRAHVVLDALGPDQRFIHGLDSRVEALAAGAPAGRSARLQETAPGRYETWLPLSGFGARALRATHSLDGHPLGRSHAEVQNAYPAEYAPAPPDAALLARAAALTGGRELRAEVEAFRPARRATSVREELWPYLAWLALGLFLLDLALRRVRLFDRRSRRVLG